MESSLRTYRVADFFFTVEDLPFAPDNLQPFLVPDCDGEKIFSLRIVKELPQCDCDLIYRTSEEPGFPVISLFQLTSGDYFFEVQPLPGKPVAGRMAVDKDFKTAKMVLCGTSDRYALNSCLMLLFTFSSASKGALEMHSSVVTYDGRGFMFLGKSGTGKGTHSQLWMRNFPGTELLNDDNPIVRLLPDGTVRVYGSPWSGKTPCYKAQDAPVGAIVRLRQAPQNRIERLGTVHAYSSVMASCSGFRAIRALADAQHETLSVVAEQVPCYQLECLPDEAAARLCYKTVHG